MVDPVLSKEKVCHAGKKIALSGIQGNRIALSI
jgi:hypothetical protein